MVAAEYTFKKLILHFVHPIIGSPFITEKIITEMFITENS